MKKKKDYYSIMKEHVEDRMESFHKKPKSLQKEVLKWISANLSSRNNLLWKPTSYVIKHMLQNDTDIYLTTEQFNEAMVDSGFKSKCVGYSVDSEGYPCGNYIYNISKTSPAFKFK